MTAAGTMRLAILALLVPFSLAHASQSGRPERPPAEYEVAIARNVMVPMRDGVRLAVDVYQPARGGAVVDGRFPALLTRTPYNKNGAETAARFLAERGYVVVIQDVRGRFASEGTFYIYVHDGEDGFDTMAWIAAQRWSNGDVGTYGGSYSAATQMALAALRPPSLRAMFVTVGTTNYFEDGAARGGAFYLLHNLAYAMSLGSDGKEAAANPAIAKGLQQWWRSDLAHWLDAYPFRTAAQSPLARVPSYQRWFQDWVDHSSYDAYWKQNGFSFENRWDAFPDVPMYFLGGWYDIFARGTLQAFRGRAAHGSAPVKLKIGPWGHALGVRAVGDVDFGDTAVVDIDHERLRWFDHVLKKKANGILSEPRVSAFVMGSGPGTRAADGRLQHGGDWVALDDWPVRGSETRTYFLHGDGGLSTNRPAGDAPASTFAFDPDNPVPTIGGPIDSGSHLVRTGPFDQRCAVGVWHGCTNALPLSARPDVLVFQTPPLTEEVTVNGPVSVTLWVSSSARDTDFTAKLVDVHPPSADYPHGYDLPLLDRIQRARFRRSPEREELLTPGEVYELTIDLIGTAARFKRGHRIRVDISSSNYPFYDVNPNTGERLGHHTDRVTARNTVYHDQRHASGVTLQVVRPR